MNRICKIISYVTVSVFISFMDYKYGKGYLNSFVSIIIPSLATLFTINIATSSIIVAEMNKHSKKYPSISFDKAKMEMKRGFSIQIVSLLLLLIIYPLAGCVANQSPLFKDWSLILYNAYSISVFVYYMECIYDLGLSLFKLMDTDS